MAQLRELKGRIKATANIKRITNTMQMIATAKFQASVRRATETKPYTEKVAELVGELAAAAQGGEEAGGIDHPLLRKPETPTNRELVLILTSNRGLCGAYNANVLRTADHYIKADTDKIIDVQVVGKKGIAFARFNGYTLDAAHTHIDDKPAYEDVEALGSDYMERFTAGKYDAVKIIYMQFISNARQEPRVLDLLPLQPPKADESADGSSAWYDFSPDPAEILAELLPLTVKSQLFQAFNEAVVSEQVMRMVAMKAATDNADQMGKRLKRSFNRARQAQITTELTEIVSGAAALE
jgi:F-type H+-transporting ATPase subunit gamma